MSDKQSRELQARKVLSFLKDKYPDARCHLSFTTPLELLVGSILSAQCTDERVNKVTEKLFRKYRDAEDFAKADIEELERDIRTTGFFRNKAKSIKKSSNLIIEHYDGGVPDTVDELVKLPGVGRKTANVITGNYYAKPAIIVDTHIRRLSNRLALSDSSDPVKIEYDLREILPEYEWTFFSNALGDHGRTVCKSRTPLCHRCDISGICPYFDKLSKLKK